MDAGCFLSFPQWSLHLYSWCSPCIPGVGVLCFLHPWSWCGPCISGVGVVLTSFYIFGVDWIGTTTVFKHPLQIRFLQIRKPPGTRESPFGGQLFLWFLSGCGIRNSLLLTPIYSACCTGWVLNKWVLTPCWLRDQSGKQEHRIFLQVEWIRLFCNILKGSLSAYIIKHVSVPWDKFTSITPREKLSASS